jgi:hypothetical protein
LNCTDCSVAGAPGCTLQKPPELRTLEPDLSHRQRSACPSTGLSSLASSVVQLASARFSSKYGVSATLRAARQLSVRQLSTPAAAQPRHEGRRAARARDTTRQLRTPR